MSISQQQPAEIATIPIGFLNPSKKFVLLRVVFLKIGEIDTVKEQYGADIFIQAKWREPSLDNKTAEELKSVNCKQLWNPRLFIENELADKKSVTTHRAFVNERGEAYISEWRKMRGDFLETLELQDFPLDVQDLSITVVSERSHHDVELVLDHNNPPRVNVDTFVDAQEWHLYEHIEITKKVHVEFANETIKRSVLRFTCQAARRPGFFYYNIFLVIFFITSLSFATFSVQCTLPQNRLQLSFTLVLTAVAFKIAIGSTLPKVSYLTLADKYVLLSLFYLVLLCTWHAFAGVLPELCYRVDKNTSAFYQSGSEQYVILGFFFLYLIGHVGLVTHFVLRVWDRRTETAQKARKFQKNNQVIIRTE